MRYFVLHGHLYQPPRENPWTELIERQPSASPFHDWNARVSDECYERYGGAGIRGPDDRVIGLVNLFARMSFNIGPTLAAWLEHQRPDVIADARLGWQSAKERTGRGPALMQAYGHAILPLCEPRERALQIAWGQHDFERHFGEPSEGIWFPETAIDLPSLDAAAEAGLAFTIVAPEQIRRIRPEGSSEWTDVSGGHVPPHRPYRVKLPSGRSIVLFPFDGALSRAAAFGGVLKSGGHFVSAIRDALDGMPADEDGVVLLAADGETFGHHQRGAEEAVAEALVRTRMTSLARVTHLGEVMRDLPVTWEAEIVDPSSWSCAHGVDRWSNGCPCGDASLGEDWSREWRAVLRQAVNSLRDRVFAMIDRRGDELFRDPWAAAHDYGRVVVAPASGSAVADLIDRHGVAGLGQDDRDRAGRLLELVRQVLFSATSCGWFFDDISGIEATQVLRHAARAAELCHQVFGIDPEPDLMRHLARARSNVPSEGSGDRIYRRRAARDAESGACGIRLHALRHLESYLATGERPRACGSTLGVFAVNDAEDPEVHRENGATRIEGRANALHRRTGRRIETSFVVEEPHPAGELSIHLADEPGGVHASLVREEMLRLTARRATSVLPTLDEALLARYAWIGRDARALGVTLPPPFPEAMRAGARALLSGLLADVPRANGESLRRLKGALEASRVAGLDSGDVADLRPQLDRLLAFEVERRLAAPRDEEICALCTTLKIAGEIAGDEIFLRTRRSLHALAVREEDERPDRDALLNVAKAAGMAADALAPLDVPVRKTRSEEELDALL